MSTQGHLFYFMSTQGHLFYFMSTQGPVFYFTSVFHFRVPISSLFGGAKGIYYYLIHSRTSHSTLFDPGQGLSPLRRLRENYLSLILFNPFKDSSL